MDNIEAYMNVSKTPQSSITWYLHCIQHIEEVRPKALLKAFEESIVTEDKYLKPLEYYKATYTLNNILILLEYLEDIKKLTLALPEKIDFHSKHDPYYRRDWPSLEFHLKDYVKFDTSELQAQIRTLIEEINNTSFEAVKESALNFFSVLRGHVESQIDNERLVLNEEEKLELYNLCEQGLIEVRKVLPLVEKYYAYSDNCPFDDIIHKVFPDNRDRPYRHIYEILTLYLETNFDMTWTEKSLWDLHRAYVKTIWLLGYEVKPYNEYVDTSN